MKIEALWYEYSPYLYAVGGVVSVSNYTSYISLVSGILLLVASATILRLRLVYRKNKVLEKEKAERRKRVAQRQLERSTTITQMEEDEL